MAVIVDYKKTESVSVEMLADTINECGIIAASSCGLGVKVEIDTYCDHYKAIIGPFHDSSDAEYFQSLVESALKEAAK